MPNPCRRHARREHERRDAAAASRPIRSSAPRRAAATGPRKASVMCRLSSRGALPCPWWAISCASRTSAPARAHRATARRRAGASEVPRARIHGRDVAVGDDGGTPCRDGSPAPCADRKKAAPAVAARPPSGDGRESTPRPRPCSCRRTARPPSNATARWWRHCCLDRRGDGIEVARANLALVPHRVKPFSAAANSASCSSTNALIWRRA